MGWDKVQGIKDIVYERRDKVMPKLYPRLHHYWWPTRDLTTSKTN